MNIVKKQAKTQNKKIHQFDIPEKAQRGDVIQWINSLDFKMTGQVDFDGTELVVSIDEELPRLALNSIKDYVIIT